MVISLLTENADILATAYQQVISVRESHLKVPAILEAVENSWTSTGIRIV